MSYKVTVKWANLDKDGYIKRSIYTGIQSWVKGVDILELSKEEPGLEEGSFDTVTTVINMKHVAAYTISREEKLDEQSPSSNHDNREVSGHDPKQS